MEGEVGGAMFIHGRYRRMYPPPQLISSKKSFIVYAKSEKEKEAWLEDLRNVKSNVREPWCLRVQLVSNKLARWCRTTLVYFL